MNKRTIKTTTSSRNYCGGVLIAAATAASTITTANATATCISD